MVIFHGDRMVIECSNTPFLMVILKKIYMVIYRGSVGFHSHGGTSKWMVYFMENPKIKWMMTRGTPMSGNVHIVTLPKDPTISIDPYFNRILLF